MPIPSKDLDFHRHYAHMHLYLFMFNDLRSELIVFKLLQLFNITNVKQLCNLGKYICRALKLRADTL